MAHDGKILSQFVSSVHTGSECNFKTPNCGPRKQWTSCGTSCEAVGRRNISRSRNALHWCHKLLRIVPKQRHHSRFLLGNLHKVVVLCSDQARVHASKVTALRRVSNGHQPLPNHQGLRCMEVVHTNFNTNKQLEMQKLFAGQGLLLEEVHLGGVAFCRTIMPHMN